MVVEISVGVIALAFVVLTIFSVIALRKTMKTLKKADQTITDIHKKIDKFSAPGLDLINDVDKLTKDITKKSEALDFLFLPFYSKKNGKTHPHFKDGQGKVIVDSLEFIADGILLFNKIKNGMKGHVKKK
jgi:hypothetical protein